MSRRSNIIKNIFKLIIIQIIILHFPLLVFSESATIIIEGNKSLGQVNPLVWGTNLVTDSDSGEGVWVPKKNFANSEMVKVTTEVGIKFLRFPGGCITHNYSWKDGIGPVESRPRSESIWGHKHHNKFGIAEFVKFCCQVKAEPIVTVSYFAEGPKEAAELVEYCNGSVTTVYGALRKEHGHPGPFNIKYWEVGNEVWHGTAIPHENLSLYEVTPSAYAHRFKKFYNEMKEKDPSIVIGAVGFEMGLKGFDSFGMYWNRNVLEIAGNDIDFLSIHSYLPGFHTKPSLNPIGHFKALMAASGQTAYGISEIQSLWNDLSSTSEMKTELKIAFTEYHAGFLSEERFSWGGALYTADFIMMMLSLRNQVMGSNYMEHSNGFWGMFKGSNPIIKRQDAEIFKLLSQNIGKLIVPVKVSCSSFEPPDIGFIHSTKTLISGRNTLNEINLVKDPGFEKGTLSEGPWYYRSVQGASVNIDSGISHTGNNSVRVDFDGTKDINFLNVFQTVDLVPGNSYRLSGYIRTKNLKPDNSVSLALMDINNYKSFNLYTLRLAETNCWTWVEKIFKVPAKVEKANLMLRRFEGDGKISGTAWFDDISIKKYDSRHIEKPSILTAFATKSKNNKDFVLWVINRSPTKFIDTAINFPEVYLSSNKCKIKTIVGDGTGEKALFSKQMQTINQNISFAKKTIKYNLAPASLTCFSFE